MGKQKNCQCSSCNTKHQRPVGKNCKNNLVAAADVSDIDLSFSDTSVPSEATVAHPVNSDINGLLLSELKHLSSKMDSMEK